MAKRKQLSEKEMQELFVQRTKEVLEDMREQEEFERAREANEHICPIDPEDARDMDL